MRLKVYTEKTLNLWPDLVDHHTILFIKKIQTQTMNIKKSVFYCLLLSLVSYGFNYHVGKAFIHLSAAFSIINILIALNNKSFKNISTETPTLFMIGALLASAITTLVYFVLYDNPTSSQKFSDFSYPILFFIIILPSLSMMEEDRNIVLYAGIISCVAMAGAGIVDFISHNSSAYRTSGSQNMPIIYASCVAILTAWMIAEFFRSLSDRRWLIMGFCLIAIISGFTAVLFTGSRGPIIACIATFIALLIYYKVSSPSGKSQTCFLLTTASLCIILSISLSTLEFIDNLKDRFQHGINNISTGFDNQKRKPTSTGIRLDMWEASLTVISDHPFTGIGSGNHQEYFRQLEQEKRININTETLISYDHMHNDFIQAWLDMGLAFGTIALLIIFYPTLLFIYKIKDSKAAIGGLAVCLIIILCGLTDVPLHRAPSLTLFLLVICLHLVLLNKKISPLKLEN
jgi:O-antigen ligase